jgi:hypothetical protein
MNISSQKSNQTADNGYETYSFIGKSFKVQLQELDKVIEITKNGTNTQIETDQENLIAMAPIKAMRGELKCSISKSNSYWILKLIKTGI